MQPGVEGERLLKFQAIETCGLERVENQVPAMSRYRARNRHEAMATKTIIAKGLLARGRNPGRSQLGFGTASRSTAWMRRPEASVRLQRRLVARYSEAVPAHTWPCKRTVALVRIRRA
jgi:hypothetical protein